MPSFPFTVLGADVTFTIAGFTTSCSPICSSVISLCPLTPTATLITAGERMHLWHSIGEIGFIWRDSAANLESASHLNRTFGERFLPGMDETTSINDP
jgi:hypothetical protein